MMTLEQPNHQIMWLNFIPWVRRRRWLPQDGILRTTRVMSSVGSAAESRLSVVSIEEMLTTPESFSALVSIQSSRQLFATGHQGKCTINYPKVSQAALSSFCSLQKVTSHATKFIHFVTRGQLPYRSAGNKGNIWVSLKTKIKPQ